MDGPTLLLPFASDLEIYAKLAQAKKLVITDHAHDDDTPLFTLFSVITPSSWYDER